MYFARAAGLLLCLITEMQHFYKFDCARILRSSMKRFMIVLTSLLTTLHVPLSAQVPSNQLAEPRSTPFERRYRQGETLRYKMTGSNHGWQYQIQADGIVKKDAEGLFYEQIGWSNLRSNAPMALSAASLDFRQQLSLSASKYLVVPNLNKVQPFLIGPITDLLTFYSDVFLANELKLSRAGQHAYFPHGSPNSWADGQHVLLGQDSIDFDLSLSAIDSEEHTATLLVRHVPPAHPQVKLPAEWMQARVGDAANNWVQVEKSDHSYVAQVGAETFEVRVKLDSRDGKIVSAELHNSVVFRSRECEDADLSRCDAPKTQTILRQVTLLLAQ